MVMIIIMIVMVINMMAMMINVMVVMINLLQHIHSCHMTAVKTQKSKLKSKGIKCINKKSSENAQEKQAVLPEVQLRPRTMKEKLE